MDSKKARNWVELGSFELTQNTMRISDPFYISGGNNCSLAVSAHPGKWNAAVLQANAGFNVECSTVRCRCACLAAWHEICKSEEFRQLDSFGSFSSPEWKHEGNVWVDTAMVGIYDAVLSSAGDIQDLFLEANDNAVRKKPYAGILPYGVVSESGFGDGEYPVYIHRDADGCVDGVVVRFL